MEARPVFFFMYIGYNRTGKSVTAQTAANHWAISNPDGIIAGYDPQHRFEHLIDERYLLSGGERGWWDGNEERAARGRRPLNELRNALVICDDMKGLNPSPATMPDLLRLMEFRAEYGLDIIMVVHSPGLILEGLSIYVSYWYIFYTKGRKAKFEDKIENYEECMLAARIMRDYVNEYPSIIKQPKQFYDQTLSGKHTFPHIIVDTDNGELIPQNIHEGWWQKNEHKYIESII